MLFNMNLRDILIILPLLIMSLSVHEYAHARVSTAFGDPTPGNQGRLTLNPLAHMDPMGTLMLVVAGFGWGRPVMIDDRYYKNRNLGLVFTSLAGPLTNLGIAVVILFFFKLMFLFPLANSAFIASLFQILQQAAFLNVMLFVFNMIPIPPLDGSRLVSAALHKRPDLLIPYNRYGGYFLLFIILADRFFPMNLFPLGRWAGGVFNLLAGLIL
jgi:Zn-dependent protease